MQLNLTGHHIDVTPALRSFTTEKFERLQKHTDHITNVHVTFSVEKLTQIAEANLHFYGTEIHARAEAEDLYAAVDSLVDKILKQLKKHKEKDEDRR